MRKETQLPMQQKLKKNIYEKYIVNKFKFEKFVEMDQFL